MDGDTWCTEANITAPDVVRAVHSSYIDAGAELVIANTYATSPLLFDHLDRGGDVERIDRIAVDLARQAADGRVPIGGSISVMRPVTLPAPTTSLSFTTGPRSRRTSCTGARRRPWRPAAPTCW